jgi:hypothetical protein
MPLVGFEPTIPVFERAKSVHALDCATTDRRALCLLARILSCRSWGVKLSV